MRPSSFLAVLAALTTAHAASLLNPGQTNSNIIDARAISPEQVYALCETVQLKLVEDLHAIEAAVNSTGLPWDGDLAEMNKYLMDQIRQTYALVGTVGEISRVTKKVADRAGAV